MEKKNSLSAFRIDADLKRQAQEQAKKESRTLTSLIIFVLKKYLEEQKKAV